VLHCKTVRAYSNSTAHACTVSVTGRVLPGNIDDGTTSISLDSGQITDASPLRSLLSDSKTTDLLRSSAISTLLLQ
jgi:hypothetical protein